MPHVELTGMLWPMRFEDQVRDKRSRTTLGALRRDVRGNTMAMMAIALIPLSALVGSGVDTARTYVVKTRLQQACDAGVLAGRKFMTVSAATTLDATAVDQANKFFANNFPKDAGTTPGYMGTKNVVFTPTKTADQQVSGTAGATVPMTIMKMFKAGDLRLSVTCEARYDVADSDIMFVLDVTGSMACTPEANCSPSFSSYTYNGQTRYAANELPGSRMQAMREAVVDFDTTVRNNAERTTRLRYGFVPYASAVNVGALIPAEHMKRDRWSYQSRRVVGEDDVQTGGWANSTSYNTTNCDSAASRTPATGYVVSAAAYVAGNTNTYDNVADYVDRRIDNGRCQTRTRRVTARWRYQAMEYDIAAYYQTLFNGQTVDNPTRFDSRRSGWNGCIEERETQADTTFDIDDLPADLDPDLIPNSDATRWKPMWADVAWARNGQNSIDLGSPNGAYTDEILEGSAYYPYDAVNRAGGGFAACPPQARRLAEMTSAQVSAYVNATDFRPHGGTYHDVGLIWGLRMLSPNGIFAADTAASNGRPAPRRHIVFMTDGQLSPNPDVYGLYGINRYDNRVGGGANTGDMTARHTARFLSQCRYARERLNVTVWVVTLSTALNDDLKACATPGDHAFSASNKTQLQDAFRRIAEQVAMLRVSK